jgi:anti-sigma regulatory factor (Ser/Thr protein kinase)
MTTNPNPLNLPFTRDAPALARSYVRMHGAHLPSAQLEDALLATSELVANAIEHGQPGVVLNISFDPPHLTVAVADAGGVDDLTVVGHPINSNTHGRGLMIVEAVSSRWGLRSESTGRSVWFHIGE